MEDKIKLIYKFVLENIITLIPLVITYLFVAQWLSDVDDFGRTYSTNPDLDGGIWMAFHTLNSSGRAIEMTQYEFNLFQMVWSVIISSVVLIVIGKLIYLGLMRIVRNRSQ